MKILKLALLICGGLGIAGLMMLFELMWENDPRNEIVLLIAYALPVVMAAIALVKPPLQAWQAGVALAGFALAAWKLRIWEAIRLFGVEPNGQRLMVIGAGLGVIVAIVAILRPPEPT